MPTRAADVESVEPVRAPYIDPFIERDKILAERDERLRMSANVVDNDDDLMNMFDYADNLRAGIEAAREAGRREREMATDDSSDEDELEISQEESSRAESMETPAVTPRTVGAKNTRSDSGIAMRSPAPVQPRSDDVVITGVTPARTQSDVHKVDFDVDKHFWHAEGDPHWYCKICHPGNVPNPNCKATGKGGLGRDGRFAGNTTSSRRAMMNHVDKHARDKPQKSSAAAQHDFFEGKSGDAEQGLLMWGYAFVDCGWAFNTASRSSFRQAVLHASKHAPLNRNKAKEAVTKVACSLRNHLQSLVKGGMVLLGVDGGTMNGRTCLNFVMSPTYGQRKVYFIRSVRVNDCTAATIASHTKDIIDHCSRAYNVRVIGIVTDNASAMVRAAADVASDEEATDEDKELPDDPGADINIENAQEMFIHVRCWAHTFQLCIGDLAKLKELELAVSCVKRMWKLSREEKSILRNIRLARQELRTGLIKPAVTRWNSFTKAALRILDFANDLVNLDLKEPLTQDETFACSLFVLVTGPFCWATTAVQADGKTLCDAAPLIKQIQDDLIRAQEVVQHLPEAKRNLALKAITCAQESLKRRKSQYIDNDATKLLQLLDPQHFPDPEESAWLVAFCHKYLKTVGRRTDSIEREIQFFCTRAMEEVNRDAAKFWKSHTHSYAHLARIYEEVSNLACTEAACERSFQMQSALWRKERSRMEEEAVDDSLFVRFNYDRLRQPQVEEVRAPPSPFLSREAEVARRGFAAAAFRSRVEVP